MREAARAFDGAMAAVGAAGEGGVLMWLPQDCQHCCAGNTCMDEDEVHFLTFSHPRELLEKKGLVAPCYERVAAMDAAAGGSSSSAAAAAACPPTYEGVVAMDAAAIAAAQQQARAGRLVGPFGGYGGSSGGSSGRISLPLPASAPSSGPGNAVRMLSDMMDEAARVAEQARECAESGRKEQSVDLYREAAGKLLSLVEAHAADLVGVLRQELDVRAAMYSKNADVIVTKLEKARVLRNHTIKELRDTEKSYLQGLRAMESIYHAQIVADLQSVGPVIKRNDENIVFGQLTMLINYSQHLHQRLCDFVPEQPGAQAALPCVDDATFQRVLGVLEQKFQDLGLLQKYVEKLGEAQSITDMWNRDEEVSHFLISTHTKKLHSAHHAPTQRTKFILTRRGLFQIK